MKPQKTINLSNMKSILTLTIIASLGAASVNAQILTNAYNPATGHNYYLLAQSTWTVAESQAITLGGHLVTINDAAEDNWVSTAFSHSPGSAAILPYTGTGKLTNPTTAEEALALRTG
jgi:hypothetical protein